MGRACGAVTGLKEGRRSSSFRDRNVAGTSFRIWKGWRRPQGRGFRRGFEGKGAASRSPKRGTPGRGGSGRSISPRRGERKAGECILPHWPVLLRHRRSEEHTSELQSLMRISYAVFCLKKKNR